MGLWEPRLLSIRAAFESTGRVILLDVIYRLGGVLTIKLVRREPDPDVTSSISFLCRLKCTVLHALSNPYHDVPQSGLPVPKT